MSQTIKLKNGNVLLSTEAPGGIYNSSQLKKIAAICDRDSIIMKATEDQRIALFVSPARASAITDELKSIGLGVRHYQDGLHQPVSCLGELCEDHEQDALGSSLDISSEIEAIQLSSPLKIGINGCAKCCVPCHTLDVSLVGDAHGYRISLGGKNSQLPEMASFMAEGVPAAEIPRLVKGIVLLFKEHGQAGESLQEVIERVGSKPFVEMLQPWSQDAADSSDPFASETPMPEAELVSNDGDSNLSDLQDQPSTEVGTDEIMTDFDMPSESNAGENVEIADDIPALEDVDLQMSEPTAIAENQDLPDLTNADDVLNLDANEQHRSTSTDLDEIPVDNLSMIEEVNVPIDMKSSPMPDIQLQDAELLEESFDEADALSGEPATESPDFATEPLEAAIEPAAASPDFATDSLEPAIEATIEPTATDSLDHMSEDSIDAGDALRSVPAPQVVDEFADGVEIPEATIESQNAEFANLEEEEAEAKLTAGIEAQHDILDNDNSDFERDESSAILDSSSVTLSDSDELSLPEPEMIDELKESSLVEDDTAEDFDIHDHLPLSEVVATRKIVAHPTVADKKQWTVSGIDLDESGNPSISFANGVTVIITPEAISSGQLKIGGHNLIIRQHQSGIDVQVDGLKLRLPSAA